MTADVSDGRDHPDSALQAFVTEYAPLGIVGGFVVLSLAALVLFLFGDESIVWSFLEDYGFSALFCILVLEGAMLLYFAPSEALVPAGIQFLAASTGDLDTIVAVVLVASAGATVGQYALFSVAKRTGRSWLLSRRWFRVSESRIERFDRWFADWGRAAVPLSNAMVFTRGMVTVPAGFAEMEDAEFVVLSALGSVVFQTWLALAWIGALELGAF